LTEKENSETKRVTGILFNAIGVSMAENVAHL